MMPSRVAAAARSFVPAARVPTRTLSMASLPRSAVSMIMRADAIVRAPVGAAQFSSGARRVVGAANASGASANVLRTAWRRLPVSTARRDNAGFFSVRCLCTAKPGQPGAAGAGAAEEGAGTTARPMRQGHPDEDPNRARSVFVTVLQFSLGTLALYALFQTVKVLMPTSMSTNSFYNRASDTVRADPEIVSQFGGDIKTYGADTNQRREGRRFHVPEYRYTLDNVDYLRIVFNLEGPSGLKGKVYAEVRSDQPDRFHYLIIEKLATGEVITLQDNRAPVKPKKMRQSEVCMNLQALRSTLYGKDAEEDTILQKKELGESFNIIRYIQCDENPYECTSKGVTSTPAWIIEGQMHEGFQELEKLEKICDKLKHRTQVTADS